MSGKTLLLIDDHYVLYRSGTERVMHEPVRHELNPLITPETEYEGEVAWTSIYRDPVSGKYQVWYQGYAGYHAQLPQCTTCYAESDDGLHFTKPDQGLFKWNGHDTNIVMVGNGGHSFRYCNSVIVDERDPDPDKRYKMAYFDFAEERWGGAPGLHVAFSPDGINWTVPDIPMPRQPIYYAGYERTVPCRDEPRREGQWIVPLSSSDARDVFYDESREEFVDYGKMWLDGPGGKTGWKHAMGRTASKDFINWSKPELVLTPDDDDLPWVEFHTSPVFRHADCYFALVQILNRAVGGGVIDIELIISRDGFNWQRPFRDNFFIPREGGKSFEAGSIFTNTTPVILNDEIRLYYGAYSMGATSANNDEQNSGIGLVTLPRDRFAGIGTVAVSDHPTLSEPLHDVGQVTLKETDLTNCTHMTLNADASAGDIRVELLDADGYRVEGLTEDDAVLITGDSLRHEVRWNTRAMTDIQGEYRVRIHLHNAEVFAVDIDAREGNSL
jgi:hypothetical protein